MEHLILGSVKRDSGSPSPVVLMTGDLPMTTRTVRVKQLRGRIDFAVITIREDEFEAVLGRFSSRQPVIDGKQIYEYASVGRPDGTYTKIAVVRAWDQGQSVAQSVARDVIDDLDPRWIILVGIAGGVPDNEFSLGDVLIASRFHDFSITAAIESERPQFRPAGGPGHPAVERLIATLPAWRARLGEWNQEARIGRKKPSPVIPDNIDAQCFYGSERTRETVRDILQKHFPISGINRDPIYKIGAVATANVLLKDTVLLSMWQIGARDITHVEMEVGGVYMAARHGRPQEIPVLCIRGISDIVGFKRGGDWTQFACDVAASFFQAMVTTLPLEFFYNPTFFQRLQHRIDRLVRRLLP